MYLSVLRYIIKSRTKKGLYDLNKQSEPFFRDLLNQVYGWDLENLNQIQWNYPAIDLGDPTKSVCVQVTAQSDSTKIHGTIKKFVEKALYNEYERLIVLIVTDKKSYTFKPDTKEKFTFDAKRDILDVDDVLSKIETLPLASLEDIHDFLATELSAVVSVLADKSSLLAQAEAKIELPPSNANKLFDFLQYTPEELAQGREDVLSFYKLVTALPKRTREYLLIFATRGETPSGIGCNGIVISPRALESFCGLSRNESAEEFRILESKGIADVYDEHGQEIRVLYGMETGVDLIGALKEYCDDEKKLYKLLVECDFKHLDDEPDKS